MWNEADRSNVRHCFGMFLEVLVKTTKESQSGYSTSGQIFLSGSYFYSIVKIITG